MSLVKNDRTTVMPRGAPSTPRLRIEPTGSRRTLLDGGWWPRSTDPVAELPGLVLAIDHLRGPVTRLVLSAEGWDSHPRRLSIGGRVLQLGYFASQPSSLLTAFYANDRVDLLIVPPHTAPDLAGAAMVLAATTSNLVHAQDILLAVSSLRPVEADGQGEDVWEAEGGRVGRTPTPLSNARQPVPTR